MTLALLVLGAVFGAVALGFPGFVLGAGLGYGLALLLELRQRLDRLERTMEARRRRIAAELASHSPPPSPPSPPPPFAAAERYPEEAMVDALRESGDDPRSAGSEMEDVFRQVAPPPSGGKSEREP